MAAIVSVLLPVIVTLIVRPDTGWLPASLAVASTSTGLLLPPLALIADTVSVTGQACVGVRVGVRVIVGVRVKVRVLVGVTVFVGVRVLVGVLVGVLVRVGVFVIVFVGV